MWDVFYTYTTRGGEEKQGSWRSALDPESEAVQEILLGWITSYLRIARISAVSVAITGWEQL